MDEIEPLLVWYKRTGYVTVESLGLDSRTVIIKIEGRRGSFNSLVTIYDPSSGAEFSEWLEDLIDSHRRAGIKFDRVEVWVSPERLEESEEESEKIGANVIVRSLSELGSAAPLSSRSTEFGRSAARKEDTPPIDHEVERGMNMKSISKGEKPVSITVLDGEIDSPDGVRDLSRALNEIKEVIDRSMRTILDEVRRVNEIDLIRRMSELEKRVELLEAMIRLLGSQRVPTNEPSTESIMEHGYHAKQERVTHDPDEQSAPEKEFGATIGEQQVNISSNVESRPKWSNPEPSEEVLEEILSNPWVKILSKKGEDVEG